MSASRLLQPTGPKAWVDTAKGIAILLVVLYHSMLFMRSIGLQVDGMSRLKILLELFPMPVFLFIAGLTHYRVLQWSLAATWKRRLLGYLWLYVIWSVLRFAFYYVVPNVRADGAGATATDPLALLAVLVWPINSYWFLLALFVFTLVLQAVRRIPRSAALIAAAALSTAVGSDVLTTTNVGWDRMAEYLLFFLLGAFFPQEAFRRVGAARTRTVVLTGAAYAVVALSTAIVPRAVHVPGVSLVGELAAVAFGTTLSVRLARLRPLRFLGHVGARSLQVYLLHVFVIALAAAALILLPQLRAVPFGGLAIGTLLVPVAVIASLALARLLDRAPWLLVPPRRLVARLTSSAPASTARSAPARVRADGPGIGPQI